MAFSDPYEEWKAQGRPGGSFAAWQGGQRMPETAGGLPMPQAAPQQGGIPSVDQIAQQAQGHSEDFRRFLDVGGDFNQQGQGRATLEGWNSQYYDAAASKAAGRPQYRSMRGAQGFYDKPTECPPGQGPSGGNETDPCTSVGYGGVDQGVQQQAQSNPWAVPVGQANPLQGMLTGVQQTPAQPAQGDPLKGAVLPYVDNGVRKPQGFMDTLSGAMQGIAQKQQPVQGLAGSLGTGWSAGADGLTQMMSQRQRKLGPQASGQWWG